MQYKTHSKRQLARIIAAYESLLKQTHKLCLQQGLTLSCNMTTEGVPVVFLKPSEPQAQQTPPSMQTSILSGQE